MRCGQDNANFSGGKGITEALGANVGDAVALGVGVAVRADGAAVERLAISSPGCVSLKAAATRFRLDTDAYFKISDSALSVEDNLASACL